MKSLPLMEVTDPVDTFNPSASDREAFTYVDLSAVNNRTKSVENPSVISTVGAPSRARQVLMTGDVLVSTVRPNLNAVALVPPSLNGSIASTGFTVLRASERDLDHRYLFHWVQTPGFVKKMVSMATGASYPAISDRIVKSSVIPCPALVEQRRIADLLDKADALRAKRRETIAHLDSLGQSIFHEMFGDPAINDRSWPVMKLAEMGALDRGVSKHRPRNDPALLGGIYPLIQTGDVANAGGYVSRYTATYSDFGLIQSKLWEPGTLCITIAANIAKTAILTFEACFPDSVVGFTSTKANTEFVRCWFSFLQKVIEMRAPESAQKNINLAILRNLDVISPPIVLQERFAERVQAIQTLKARYQLQLAELDTLFLSLQDRAFKGGR